MCVSIHGRLTSFQPRIFSILRNLRKQASSLSPAQGPSESVSIACPGNGNITLDLYYPRNVPASRSARPTVAVFLPRGPLLSNPTHDAYNASLLSATLPCPVVKINYRCDENAKFPTANYDVMAGYDWIQEHMLPRRSITRAGRSEHVGSLSVCGELIGGQLAMVLALTECRMGEPGIVAAAVNNPVVDWVALDESAETPVSDEDAHNMPGFSTLGVLRKRAELFGKAEHYFDPFASPIHFFRAAGVSVPKPAISPRPLSDMDELVLSERESVHGAKHNPLAIETDAGSFKPPVKAALRYPSVAFNLRLPNFHITVGEESPVRTQVEELGQRLRKSVLRQRKASLTAREVASDDIIPDDLTFVHTSPGTSVWDGSDAGRARMLDCAQWLAQRMQQ